MSVTGSVTEFLLLSKENKNTWDRQPDCRPDRWKTYTLNTRLKKRYNCEIM